MTDGVNNLTKSVTPLIKAEPVNEGKFKINDRVRIKVGSHRNSVFMHDLAGCVGVINIRHERPHCPYHIEGLTHWLYEDELVKVLPTETGKEIPTCYKERAPFTGGATTSHPGNVTYHKPAVEFMDWRELA